MRYWLENDMRPVDLALEACRQTGVEPFSVADPRRHRRLAADRDGRPDARTSSPACRRSTGRCEWVSVQDMAAAVRMCVRLVELWGAERKG